MLDLECKPVLVVDDDDAFASAVSRWLRELGFAATHAGTAADAVEALNAQSNYAFILLDLGLPDVSGLSLLRRLHRAEQVPPVIVTSGTTDVAEVIRVWREQAADFLHKPFSVDELSAAIERLAEGERAPQFTGDADAPTEPGRHGASDPDAAPRSDVPVSLPVPASPDKKRIRPVVERLRKAIRAGTISIPVIDPNVAALQQFLVREDFTMNEVADAISRDPALTLGVLRIANSAQYSRGAQVTSLLDACARLGAQRVVALALEVAVRDQFTLDEEPLRSVMQDLWRNAAVTARIAEALGRMLGRVDSEKLYVFGLLHNLGETVCVKLFAETKMMGATTPNLERMAHEVAKIHEHFGSVVAMSWKLPRGLARLIGYHHRPSETPEDPVHRHDRLVVLAAWSLAVEAGYAYWPEHPGATSFRYLGALGVDPEVGAKLKSAIATWGI